VGFAAYSASHPAPQRSLFHLQGVSPWHVVQRTFADIRKHDILGRAAQLAYYFFLALFPFLICVIASLSVFGTADRGRALLFGIFARFLPRPAFLLIATTFNDILQSNGPLKMSIGVVASLWSASMGMSAVMDTLNAAYRVKETRSFLKQYAVALGLTVGLTLLLVVAVLVSVFGLQAARELPYGSWWVWALRIAEWPLGLALLLLSLAILYYFGPALKERRWHWVTPGAVAGVFLMMLISFGFRIYLRYASVASSTYGSLRAVIVLLLTFYFCGIAVLAGGTLNGVLERLAINETESDRAPSSNAV